MIIPPDLPPWGGDPYMATIQHLEKSLQDRVEELAVLKKEWDGFENEISRVESAASFQANARENLTPIFKMHHQVPQTFVQNYLKKQ